MNYLASCGLSCSAASIAEARGEISDFHLEVWWPSTKGVFNKPPKNSTHVSGTWPTFGWTWTGSVVIFEILNKCTTLMLADTGAGAWEPVVLDNTFQLLDDAKVRRPLEEGGGVYWLDWRTQGDLLTKLRKVCSHINNLICKVLPFSKEQPWLIPGLHGPNRRSEVSMRLLTWANSKERNRQRQTWRGGRGKEEVGRRQRGERERDESGMSTTFMLEPSRKKH